MGVDFSPTGRPLSGSCCLRKEKQTVPGPFALFFLLSFSFRWVFSDISKKTSVALFPQGLTFATSERRLFLVNSCYRRKGPWNWVWLSSSSPPSLRERIITALCVGCVSPENDSSCFPGMGVKYIFIYTLLKKSGWPPGQFSLRQANIWAFCLRNKVRHGYAKKWLSGFCIGPRRRDFCTNIITRTPGLHNVYPAGGHFASRMGASLAEFWILGFISYWYRGTLLLSFHQETICACWPWFGSLLFQLSEHIICAVLGTFI